jgi:predicted Zn-dependent protease
MHAAIMGRRHRLLVGLGISLLASGCASPIHPSDVTVYSRCGASPNYVSSVNLVRWAVFPVSVSINVDPAVRDPGYAGITDGVFAWASVLPRPLGAVTLVRNNKAADIVIDMTQPSKNGSADTQTDFYHIKQHAAIHLFLRGGDPQSLGVLDLQERATPIAFQHDLASIVAHEMGHALAIDGHSPNASDLMYGGTINLNGDPAPTHITVSDRNTFMQAYCDR